MSVEKFDPNQAKVEVTEAAAEYIKGWLAREKQSFLRLSTKKTGCSGYAYHCELAAEQGTDVAVDNAVQLPIIMPADSIALLSGMTIDFQEQGLGQRRLVYLNPNEQARCGCGESFSIDPMNKS